MAEEFKMPPIGQTSTSLTILTWFKKAGDELKQGDVLAEVETDKATLDVESYLAGTILKILREEGEVVEVGEPIAIIGAAGEELPVHESARPEGEAAPVVEDGSGATDDRASRTEKVLASPVARKRAKDLGIGLTDINGTGPGGRITKDDVEAAASVPQGEHPAPRTTTQTVSAVNRSAVARRVSRSFSTIPHIYLTAWVDMGVAKARLDAAREGSQSRITYTHIVLHGIGSALSRHPAVNVVWDDSGVPRELERSNVGLVVSGGPQLVIVTIEEPGARALEAVASLTNRAADRARSGSLASSDVAPCAVSMSNLGMYAVDQFHAVIDPDQSAMISVGRIADCPVAVDGAVKIRPMMAVTVAADHRVVDGVAVAAFLDDIKRTLEGGSDE